MDKLIGRHVKDLAMANHTAYLPGFSGYLFLLEMRKPEAPELLGMAEVKGQPEGIAVRGDLVFIPAWEEALRVFDASDPARPVEISYMETAGLSTDVMVSGDLLFHSDFWAGVEVFDLNSCGIHGRPLSPP